MKSTTQTYLSAEDVKEAGWKTIDVTVTEKQLNACLIQTAGIHDWCFVAAPLVATSNACVSATPGKETPPPVSFSALVTPH